MRADGIGPAVRQGGVMTSFADRARMPGATRTGAGGNRAHRPAPHVPRLPWAPVQPMERPRSASASEKSGPAPATNRTGLPDALKAGVEALSGLAMDDVRVHRSSREPAKLGALAYAHGSEIHLGPGQEQHLPHEAWHVVQQKQGRVKATAQLREGRGLNQDERLEREADRMGAEAARSPDQDAPAPVRRYVSGALPVVQGLFGAGAQPGAVVMIPATSLEEAVRLSALEINRRARTRARGVVDTAPLDAVDANNVGNLYIKAAYPQPAPTGSLETWIELTNQGGGYVKRVRTQSPIGTTIMDRVIDENGTAFQQALVADRMAPAAAVLSGLAKMDAVHKTEGGDELGLDTSDASNRSADNFSKMVGEGARFAWLAEKLARREIGNDSRNIFKCGIKIPQAGRFVINPTFEQLWSSWRSAFGRAYMADEAAAKALLTDRLRTGLRRRVEGDIQGDAPLGNGAQANGQVSSLLGPRDEIVLVDNPPNPSGMAMVSELHMTWHARG